MSCALSHAGRVPSFPLHSSHSLRYGAECVSKEGRKGVEFAKAKSYLECLLKLFKVLHGSTIRMFMKC